MATGNQRLRGWLGSLCMYMCVLFGALSALYWWCVYVRVRATVGVYAILHHTHDMLALMLCKLDCHSFVFANSTHVRIILDFSTFPPTYESKDSSRAPYNY